MKKTYMYLADEGVVREGYDNYIVLSENYIDTIENLRDAGRKFKVVPSCWEIASDVRRDEHYLQNVKSYVIEYLRHELNSYHKIDFSIKEWELMICAWLDAFLALIWEKYSRISKIKTGLSLCETQDVVNSYVPLDYTDFIQKTRDSWEFNNNIANCIIRECDDVIIKGIKNSHVFKYNNKVEKNKTYYKLKLFRAGAGWFSRIWGKNIRVLLNSVYFPRNVQIKWMLKSRGRIFPFETGYSKFEKNALNTKIDHKWRSNIPDRNDDMDEFTKIAIKIVKRFIPLSYLEDFVQIKRCSKKLYGNFINVNAAFYVCGGLTYDEIFKYYLIQLKRHNTKAKYCDTQHGGNYGIAHNTMIRMEFAKSDVFYSWGWRSDNYFCRVVPMPVVKLISKKIERDKDKHILYVGYTFFKEIINFTEETVFYRSHFDGEKSFFESIDEKVKKAMVVRLSQEDYGWRVKERVFRNVKDITFDDITDYYESLKYASLVVCSFWSTTVMEALFFGLPILVLKTIEWSVEDAKEDLYDMKQCGILVETWEELKKTVTALSEKDAIEKWWNTKEKREVVAKIKKKYAYSSVNDERLWEKELFKYI